MKWKVGMKLSVSRLYFIFSLYNRFLENNNETYETPSTVANAAYKSESQNTLDSKLLSISEAHFNSVASGFKSQVSRGKSSTKPIKICELGGLGPTFAQEKVCSNILISE